jgi:hypothetical protein
VDLTFAGLAAQTGGGFNYNLGDGMEAAKMEPFTPLAAGQTAPWWERAAMYGLTRAIDNRFGPQQVAGNVDSGTFAGQNGRTYTSTPGAQRGVPTTSASGAVPALPGIPGGWLTVVAGLVAAYIVLKA